MTPPTVTEGPVAQGEVVVDEGLTNLVKPNVIFNVTPCDGARCKISVESPGDDVTLDIPVGEEFELMLGEAQSVIEEELENAVYGMSKGHHKDVEINRHSLEIQQPNNRETESYEKQIGSDIAECVTQAPSADGNPTGMVQGVNADKIKIKVTLIDFQNPPNICDYTDHQKLEIAKYHKTKGVDMFQLGKRKYAYRFFSKALKYLLVMLPRKDVATELHEEFDLLRLQCYSNMAACLLKENQYESVIWNCSKSLAIDKEHVKSIYRRAEAYFHLQKYKDCRQDVATGLKLEPKSRVFHLLVQKLAGK